jgi:hypothetical protein
MEWKIHLRLPLILIFAVFIALAVDRTVDFSGKWLLIKSERSFLPLQSSGGSDGGWGGSGRGGGMPRGGSGGGSEGGLDSGGGGFPGGGGGGRRGGGGMGSGVPRSGSQGGERGAADESGMVLTITQNATEFRVERKRGSGEQVPVEQKFTLDGNPNSNPDERGRGEFVSKAKWHKEKLEIEGNLNISIGGRNIPTRVKQEFSLSKDGQVLTVKTSRMVDQGTSTTQQTFQKQ